MADSSLVEGVFRLDRRTTWTLTGTTPVHLDIGHPQGLTRFGDDWLIATVYPSAARGAVVLVDRSGSPVRQIDVTDDVRFHPGGVHCSSADSGVWAAIAEYRPDSTTTVIHIDRNLNVDQRFHVGDHLGAICDLEDGTLFAVSWGSRRLYRISADGHVLESRANPSHVIDHQDLHFDGSGYIVASGVADMAADGGRWQLGGLAVFDASDLSLVHEIPITASMPTGRSITYNGFHLGSEGGAVSFHCLVDDDDACIGHWSAT